MLREMYFSQVSEILFPKKRFQILPEQRFCEEGLLQAFLVEVFEVLYPFLCHTSTHTI